MNASDYTASAPQGYVPAGLPRQLTVSDTTVAPATGLMRITSIPAGGSGACASGTQNATGGGAGEIVTDWVAVTAGDTHTHTLGAAGASQAAAGSAGNPGTDTTHTGPNSYSLTAKAGLGGAVVASGPVAGGAGGSGGTGGTQPVRYPGGRGGSITGAGNTNKRTGGGAVNPSGRTAQTGTRGGDISQNDATARYSGGGSVGGTGGDITTAAIITSGGGGVLGSGFANTTIGGPNILNQQGDTTQTPAAGFVPPVVGIIPLSGAGGTGGGGSGAAYAAGGPGAGGAGQASAGVGILGNGGALGGGGASSAALSQGGNGGFGAGGGAGVTTPSGAGGPPYVEVQYFRRLAS